LSSQAKIEALQKAPSNAWIAFSDEEHIIAYGATYDEVVANAEAQGVVDLVVAPILRLRRICSLDAPYVDPERLCSRSASRGEPQRSEQGLDG
jgi:hypothetical protein